MNGDRGVLLPRQLSYPADWQDFPRDRLEGAQADLGQRIESEIEIFGEKLAANHPALDLSIRSVVEQIAQFRELVRSSNQLAVEHPRFRDDLLDFLDRLSSALLSLSNDLPALDEKPSEEEIRAAVTWRERFSMGLASELVGYVAPESMAKTAVPAGLIFGLGAVGALLGGPLGFGAGAMAGQLLVGHAKPGDAASRLEKFAVGEDS